MIGQVAVVVPAANEESSIGLCLTALSAAVARAPVPVRIIVVLDACTDRTADVVGTHPGVETVPGSGCGVGSARRAGAAHALVGIDPGGVWLASTDADSTVPADWISGMIRMSATSDLVLGTVVPDTGLLPGIERAWFAKHLLHDGHPHVHAANLGIRGDAYLRIGGWPTVRTGEDVELADRAVSAGLRICRDSSIPVRTSTRVVGRAPQGFSSYLRALGHV